MQYMVKNDFFAQYLWLKQEKITVNGFRKINLIQREN